MSHSEAPWNVMLLVCRERLPTPLLRAPERVREEALRRVRHAAVRVPLSHVLEERLEPIHLEPADNCPRKRLAPATAAQRQQGKREKRVSELKE